MWLACLLYTSDAADDAGANVIVAGSAIFAGDIGKNVEEFLAIMNE